MATNFIHYHSVVSGSERSDARDKLSPSPPIFRRVAVAGSDLQIRGRRGRCPKIVFSALRASVFSKNKGRGGRGLSWIRHWVVIEKGVEQGNSLSPFPFVTLKTRKKLEPKRVPQLILGLLLRTRRSVIGQFFPCP